MDQHHTTPQPSSIHSIFRPALLRPLAWGAWTLTILLIIIALIIFYVSGTTIFDMLSALSITVAFLVFGLFGLFIILQRPTNTIGWFFSLLGICTGITSFCQAYQLYGTVKGHLYPLLPGSSFVNWLGGFVWTINIASFLIFLPLLFPTGHLLSRRWRILIWLTLVVMFLDDLTGTFIFLTDKVKIFGLIINPTDANNVVQTLLFPLAIAALVSLILRFIRSRGIERQQMKWLIYGCAITLLFDLGGTLLWNDPTNFTFAAGLICLPLSLGMAILRYRLYDIDRLISRTLIYLILSALLVAIYLSLVFGLQFILQPITASLNSPFPIVISTLAIAALFQPLRRTIQRMIDRNFYRRKYNAEQVLTTFGSTLREEIELAQLSERLVNVVVETMQPEYISLWIMQPASNRSEINLERESI